MSLFSIKTYANYLVRLTGYEIVGEGGEYLNLSGYKLFPRKLPFIIYQGSEDPYFYPFTVDITSITSRLGFSYSTTGWHPFVQTLKEYENNSGLCYEESTLARLYKNFCPANVQEVLMDDIHAPMKPFCDWPARNELIRWVWALNPQSIHFHLKHLKNRPNKEGWIFFGPHSQEYGRKEFQRLIQVYESIKKAGFKTGLTGKDPVNGYFLKDGNDTRFVLLQGNHRISALKALGYSEVDVIIRSGHPAVVDRSDLYKWTKESGGLYSNSAAEFLFDAMFYESGVQKAERLDLII